jgi:ATP-binding cassette subfamily C protein CydC
VMLVVLPLIAQASFEALLPLPPAFQMLSASLTSAGRLFEVVDQEEAGTGGSEAPERKRVAGVPELCIRGLTFSYPGQTHPVLQDLDLDLPAGKKMAIVGPNGSGKTTLLNLLLRFWQAPHGCMFVGGEDLLEMTGEEARSFFSVISQRTHLFNASIRENLLLADATASDEAIQAVVRAAELDRWIESLPFGTATRTGERGFRLSGGERQRLAIARALLKKSPILLCDEPTANLDPITGLAVLNNLLAIAGDRSVLLITHQVAGLEVMDEIVVLEDGRVVERGTHASLLKRNGLYRGMVQLQGQILVDPE